jgi:hypothetical protein
MWGEGFVEVFQTNPRFRESMLLFLFNRSLMFFPEFDGKDAIQPTTTRRGLGEITMGANGPEGVDEALYAHAQDPKKSGPKKVRRSLYRLARNNVSRNEMCGKTGGQ